MTTITAVKEKEFMSEAIAEALKALSDGDGGPFGALVVKDDQVIGRAHNKVLRNNDPTSHGEILAIRDACTNIGSTDLSDCTLYTSCYPCHMCFGACYWAQLKRVVYAVDAEEATSVGFHHKEFYLFGEDDIPTLEHLPIENKMKPFDMFAKMKNSGEFVKHSARGDDGIVKRFLL